MKTIFTFLTALLLAPLAALHAACPWENSEAHLMIAWTLKHDREHPLADLLLKLSNLNRINSFYFFPAFWTQPVLALDEKTRPAPGAYFPVEPFYSLEGTGGHRGGTAAYMAGLALWNNWLYEALAEASDREIMVLNLDAMDDYESALSGIERQFLAYNPTATGRTCRVVFKHLSEADHLVTIGTGEEKHPAAELRQGLSLTLKAGEHQPFTMRRTDYRERQRQLQQQRAAQNALAHAYQLMQERAIAQGSAAIPPQEITTFTEALAAARAGHIADAEAKAKDILLSLQNNKPARSN